jgi:hypothetical protein
MPSTSEGEVWGHYVFTQDVVRKRFVSARWLNHVSSGWFKFSVVGVGSLSKTRAVPHPRWLLQQPYWKHKKCYYSWTNGSIELKFLSWVESSMDTWHNTWVFDLTYFSKSLRSKFNMNCTVGTFCNCWGYWPETFYMYPLGHITYHTNIQSDIFLGLATRGPKLKTENVP